MAHKPGLLAARRYLTSRVSVAEQEQRMLLPSIKRMAAEAGVSHTVMSAAVAELRTRGVLESRPRRGTLVCAVREQPRPEDRRTRSPSGWRDLSERIRRDLSDGSLADNPLPSQKELARRYRASLKTLRRSLRALLAESFLARAGRSFRRQSREAHAEHSTIVLFARAATAGGMMLCTPRTVSQFGVIEQVCAARGLRLQVVPCFYAGTRMTFAGSKSSSLAELFGPGQVLGFMVWRQELNREFAVELTARLLPLGKPITVLLEDPLDLADVPGLPVHRLVKCYSIAHDFEAGRALGRFLLSRNHRRIACWADGSELQWVKERIAGMRRAFADASVPDGVLFYSAWADEYLSGAHELLRMGNRLARAVGRVSAELNVRVRPERMVGIAGALYESGVYREKVYMALEPAMQRELAKGEATAWIGLNDSLAIECLRYLQRNGVAVPRKVSVVGFDDSPEAIAWQLSSYNFNGGAAIHRMVDFLLWPDSPISRRENGPMVTVQGFVHERATTAEAPRSRQ
jgi:DNA-binding LacI/PurR family transcriptional regulator/DNA-binding transcriptional regulator YhcF (GntR family)